MFVGFWVKGDGKEVYEESLGGYIIFFMVFVKCVY